MLGGVECYVIIVMQNEQSDQVGLGVPQLHPRLIKIDDHNFVGAGFINVFVISRFKMTCLSRI